MEYHVKLLEGELLRLGGDIYNIKEDARLSAVRVGDCNRSVLNKSIKEEVCQNVPDEVPNDNEGAVVDEAEVKDEDAAGAVEKAEVEVVGTSNESKPVDVKEVQAVDVKKRKKKVKKKSSAATLPHYFFIEDLD